jgi:hypothetical protein
LSVRMTATAAKSPKAERPNPALTTARVVRAVPEVIAILTGNGDTYTAAGIDNYGILIAGDPGEHRAPT